jgi:D-beta-D-heptose 7-phosphate kinase / D-beta-D-heptose 1-phosphate adenosyltransferase
MEGSMNLVPFTTDRSAIALVRQFRDVRALVIGDAMLDTYLEGTATRLCSEGPVPVVARTAEYRLPGGAANTAANVQALGADVSFLSVIGHDLAGSLFRSMLQQYGVSDGWLVEDDEVTTQHKLRIIANGQYVVRFDEGGMLPAQAVGDELASFQRQLLKQLDELYARCDLVVVSDYRYGVLFPQLLARLGELHSAQPKIVVVDSKALDHFRDVPATLVTPNYQEACQFLERVGLGEQKQQYRAGSDEHIKMVGEKMLQVLAVDAVAITLGEQGVCLFDREGHTTTIPAHPVAHANDVGAGDSFTSACALALAVGAGLVEAAQIGIDAAAIAVSAPRTTVVSGNELLRRVSLREYATQTRPFSHDSGDVAMNPAQLAVQLDADRSAGKTIVFTSGIFDIVHAGHIQLLRQVRALGDVLVVGLNSDHSVQQLKGKGRPVNSARDRAALVAALNMVDYVVLFDEEIPLDILRTLRPHIHAKGGDYAEAKLPEAEVMREIGGRVVIVPLAGAVQADGTSAHGSSIGGIEPFHTVRSSSGGEHD